MGAVVQFFKSSKKSVDTYKSDALLARNEKVISNSNFGCGLFFCFSSFGFSRGGFNL
jgi:hypothetical protein